MSFNIFEYRDGQGYPLPGIRPADKTIVSIIENILKKSYSNTTTVIGVNVFGKDEDDDNVSKTIHVKLVLSDEIDSIIKRVGNNNQLNYSYVCSWINSYTEKNVKLTDFLLKVLDRFVADKKYVEAVKLLNYSEVFNSLANPKLMNADHLPEVVETGKELLKLCKLIDSECRKTIEDNKNVNDAKINTETLKLTSIGYFNDSFVCNYGNGTSSWSSYMFNGANADNILPKVQDVMSDNKKFEDFYADLLKLIDL